LAEKEKGARMKPDQRMNQPKKTRQEFPPGKETVLLVDDEKMIVDVGTKMLDKLGYNVLTAAGGAAAVEVYQKHRDQIDLVILDMIMPQVGGAEAFDRLKALNPDIKVILSSGYTIDGQATDILNRGCSAFIQKPFNLQTLSRLIETVLQDKS
jgi:two-component system, cell cycle sensor histidine kinase and response regulator CckA